MTNGLTTESFWRMPTIPFQSWIDEVENILPTSNLINGLSMYEDEKNVYVETAVPGLESDDIEVLFQKGILTIRGERKEEEQKKRYHRKATTSYLYRVSPDNVDVSVQPEATYNNGIMTVKFAKTPEAKPIKIEVKKN